MGDRPAYLFGDKLRCGIFGGYLNWGRRELHSQGLFSMSLAAHRIPNPARLLIPPRPRTPRGGIDLPKGQPEDQARPSVGLAIPDRAELSSHIDFLASREGSRGGSGVDVRQNILDPGPPCFLLSRITDTTLVPNPECFAFSAFTTVHLGRTAITRPAYLFPNTSLRAFSAHSSPELVRAYRLPAR